ncbi:hypothetical protein CTEN210_06442 [Chaetoceros tenuissimus]|uniref:RNA-directed DNA polymerase n=1 Tax=Chaetoceros tenuissimus TaxID=426638 RepID=A0AAD3H4G1_9STRA|nr:hypothetical protein CTEN210_06442 [Chaetoceros tenuissimus]
MISRRMNKNKLTKYNPLEGPSDATAVSLATVYNPSDKHEELKSNMLILFDEGASGSMIKEEIVQEFLEDFGIEQNVEYMTGAGSLACNKRISLQVTFDEFGGATRIHHEFDVDPNPEGIGYDMIIGRDLLNKLKIDLRHSDKTIKWNDVLVPMKSFSDIWEAKHPTRQEMRATFLRSVEPKATQEETERVTKILDANYEKANLEEVVASATSLNREQKRKLLKTLKKFESLFDGTLGCWKTDPVKIQLKEGAKAVNSRWYPVPKINKETFKKELERLVKIGVLEVVHESEWGTPVFIIPKKEGTVRFVTDFRKVNGLVVRKPFPIPRIADTLQQLEGFTFATALDLNMGYYTIPLAECSKDVTTIVTEFGKFRYTCLPMGMVVSGDVFQSKIYDLIGDIEGVRTYIDDILCIGTGTFDEHLSQLEEIFQRFENAGLKVNASKCSFGLQEIPYLGYIISKEGLRPDPKKVQGIVDLHKPQTAKEMKSLIGMIQFYRDMWRRRSHILSPLIDAAAGKKGKMKITWTEEMDDAFIQLKQMVTEEVFLTYPDWSKPFDIHTDASDKQLGAVISQNGKPIAFFSRRLSKSQRNYTTTEKELLSIVECLKQFRNILFGYEINVYSDHKNLVYEATLSESQRVMRWRLLLEEFGPNIIHIAGVDNIVADTLSRLRSNNVEEDEIESTDTKIQELFANRRVRSIQADFPLEKKLLREEQQKELKKRNSKIKKLLDEKDSEYKIKELDGFELIMYKDKVYVPETLRESTLHWYHHYLNHPGGDRLGNTIKETCYWKGLSNQAKDFVKTCDVCQQYKKKRRYGIIPAKTIKELVPWRTVHVDLIGPYSVTAKQIQPGGEIKEVELKLTCMTMLDPATGWFEIAQVPYYSIEEVKEDKDDFIDKTSARISLIFEQTWLSRYPRPEEVVCDNGSEFKLHFMTLLKDFDIKPRPTKAENPQGNSPVERVHQVVQNMIKTKQLDSYEFDYIDPWGPILSSVGWAVRASYHSTLQATPAQLVFGRDMMFNLSKAIDWKAITERKRKQIARDNERENAARISHQYKVGDRVLKTTNRILRKFSKKKSDPYQIIAIHTNGTVTIQKGVTQDRLSIRRIEPFNE